ncbi:MAG: iron hydrogenase [Peptococcaceae bacterium]|nr:iron hydrogenase [Peptococcaceae bacterium]
MLIFQELIKRFWNGKIKTNTDLDSLTLDLQKRLELGNEDLPFIRDHIRIAMGLEPTGNASFQNELSLVRNYKEISQPIVAKLPEGCKYCPEDKRAECASGCKYEAQVYRRNEEPVIVNDKCLSCGDCVTGCDFGAIADKIEFVPLIELLQAKDVDVYATVAPAIAGQFGDDISLGQIRTGLKLIGFNDMIEVALFADILSIKEAYEFNKLVKTEDDFFLTSCCCPVWINLVKRNYPEMFTKMSPSVSPMIASGRFLKRLYPEAKVVFISPCIAKKSEAIDPDLKGTIDFVLSFGELKEIFEALEIDLKQLPPIEKDQASFGGRIYARTGGVSFSVKSVVNRIAPQRLIKFKAKKVDGVKDCKNILDNLSQGKTIEANFIEGMGCDGGCVGGPRTIIDKEAATKYVNEFGEDSLILTPFDNLNIMKILSELGLSKIEEIFTDEEINQLLTR